MKIPEICIYSIDNRCKYEDSGCDRLHAKCTSQWQLQVQHNWYNFRNFHSKEIEDAFEDASLDKHNISVLNPAQMGKSAREMIRILGTDPWQVEFESMTLRNLKSPGKEMDVRRLSTHSAAESKSGKATTYEWYFLDAQKIWIKYGLVDSLGKVHLSVHIKSAEIEENFIKDPHTPLTFSSSQYQYQLDFKAMTQKNMTTGTIRPVRRRPIKKLSVKPVPVPIPTEKKKDLPATWGPMKETDTILQITLNESSQEYRDVLSRVLITLPGIRPAAIKRIQNPFLWIAYKNKQDELSLRYGGNDKLNIQQLFHGTKREHVDKISKENFDWRLHGSNVGQSFGRGTYFSNRFVKRHTVPEGDMDM